MAGVLSETLGGFLMPSVLAAVGLGAAAWLAWR
jgi:hypothetical protein